MTITATPAERWNVAQKGELAFWQSADRTTLCRTLDRWYATELQITAAGVAGLSVLDLGGGPMPMAALMGWQPSSYTVVDPLPYAALRGPTKVKMVRVIAPAETYEGPVCDEVWGYNVLQHVQDPAAVLDTAKKHAVHQVRWFDWTDTPIEDHHPHSISADWLADQFAKTAGWRLTSHRRGRKTVNGLTQSYVAVVAEKQ